MATLAADLNELPYRLSYNLVAGDTLSLLIQFQLNSANVDLTDCLLRLAGFAPDGTAMTARNITPSVPDRGTFDAGLTATETGAMTPGTARYEVECTFPVGDVNFSAGAVKTLLYVTVTISSDMA